MFAVNFYIITLNQDVMFKLSKSIRLLMTRVKNLSTELRTVHNVVFDLSCDVRHPFMFSLGQKVLRPGDDETEYKITCRNHRRLGGFLAGKNLYWVSRDPSEVSTPYYEENLRTIPGSADQTPANKQDVFELQKQLDETRSHLFAILAEQNHPFKFKPGDRVVEDMGLNDVQGELVENENKRLQNQLLEARDQIFELVSDRDRPFRFEIGQKVTIDDDSAPIGGFYTVTGRQHSKRPGGQWLEGYNEYQLFHECANGLFWEAEIMLEPIVPAKKKSTKPKSKKS
jgi:hypothetical protein